jgi:hypothetical protein
MSNGKVVKVSARCDYSAALPGREADRRDRRRQDMLLGAEAHVRRPSSVSAHDNSCCARCSPSKQRRRQRTCYGQCVNLHGCKLCQPGGPLRLPGLQLCDRLVVYRHGREVVLQITRGSAAPMACL